MILKLFTKSKFIPVLLSAVVLLSACGSGSSTATEEYVDPLTIAVKGERDNTPLCLVPTQPGTILYGNELVTIDASNANEGYISIDYTGDCPKVKMQLTCPNGTTYTYNLHSGYEVFPLTIDSGNYRVAIYENIQQTQYSTIFTQDFDVDITNSYGAYLYPNQYVDFTADSEAVDMAEKLAFSANTDLDVVTNVYNYVVHNISYDVELANTVESGYLPSADNTLLSKKGICLDYSALMAAMLRSQQIPTHMEVGYAGTAYHAWISVYLSETGWVNGIIQFDGTNWELMDPTFASSSDENTLKNFIGDGSNYDTKYIY